MLQRNDLNQTKDPIGPTQTPIEPLTKELEPVECIMEAMMAEI